MTTKTSLDIAKHPWWQKLLQARNYNYYIDILRVSVSLFPNFSNCILRGVSPLAQFLTQLFSCYVLCPHSSFLDKQVLAQTSTFWQGFPTLIMYPTFLIFLFAVFHSQHNMYLSVTLHYKVNSSKASFFSSFSHCTQTSGALLRTQAQQTIADSLSQHWQVSSLLTGGNICSSVWLFHT